MLTIKPIPTRYRGCRFRSRREARFAVLFDRLNIRWQHEPEGYEIDGRRRYLPDFLLPDEGLWVEVKGQPPTMEEFEKAMELAVAMPDRAVVITWENFEPRTAGNNVGFWHDEHGVFHIDHGVRWLDRAELGWDAARSARFDNGDVVEPLYWLDLPAAEDALRF